MTTATRIPASGKITRGITPNALLDQTITFVQNQLPIWRDDTTRPKAQAEEEDLNGQLCKFLNDNARHNFPMAYFHHEEKQGNRRRVDLSALPTTKAIQAAIYSSIYEPFLVMEGKRLPAPARKREREYLTGFDDQSGGIQRFRLCLHGRSLTVALIIGYVQTGDVANWVVTINGWISALKASGEDKTCVWTDQDLLNMLQNDGTTVASRCESEHSRTSGVSSIRLIHLWVCMSTKTPRSRKQKSA